MSSPRSARRAALLRGGFVAAVTASLGLLAASGEQPTPAARGEQPHPIARAATSEELAARAGPAGEAVRIDLLQRAAQERAARDVFAAHSWEPPPPPPPPPAAPPPPEPPSAPPVPFTFLGSFEAADGKPVYYLAEGDRLHVVSAGEVLNEVWRVEEPGVDEMVLTYLPLAIRQPLALGSAR